MLTYADVCGRMLTYAVCRLLAQRHNIKAVPMFLIYLSGRLVYASNTFTTTFDKKHEEHHPVVERMCESVNKKCFGYTAEDVMKKLEQARGDGQKGMPPPAIRHTPPAPHYSRTTLSLSLSLSHTHTHTHAIHTHTLSLSLSHTHTHVYTHSSIDLKICPLTISGKFLPPDIQFGCNKAGISGKPKPPKQTSQPHSP